MRIAVIQSKIDFENKHYNIDNGISYIASAVDAGAELVLFPEMSFTGFSMDTALTGETDGYTVNLMLETAKSRNITIGFGYVLIRDKLAENHYVIAGNDGSILSDYTKIHSFSIGGEGAAFRSGFDLPSSVSLCGHNIASFICYDLRFPEIFRAVCDRSTIITIAANWPAARAEQWTALLKARAIENQVYIAGINCTGTQGDIEYNGQSAIFAPNGERIAYAGSEQKMLICDIPNNVARYRKDFPVLESRRCELYKEILLPPN